MFSVTPEPATSASAYGPRTRQERLDPRSEGFSALVDSNATPAETDRKPASAPDAPPQRNDARDDRRNNAAAAGRDTSPSPRENNTASSPEDASTSTQAADSSTGPGKKPGAAAAATEDKKADAGKPAEHQADALIVQPVPATVPDIAAIVIAAATAPAVAPAPNSDVQPAPGAIAAAAVATAAAVASAVATQDQTGQTATRDGTGTITAETDPEAAAQEGDAVIVTNGTDGLVGKAAPTTGHGKTEISVKTAEDVVSSKDSKHIADTSSKTTTPDQADKPDAGTAAGSKPAEHDKTTAAKGDADSAAQPDKAALQPEHRTQAAAPSPQRMLPPDQSLQSSSAMTQQPVQNHLANVTVTPVATVQSALPASIPVPVNGLAVDIAMRAAGGSSRFEIRLDPAELGRIDVRLDVDKHGNVTSHLTVERPATLDMLRRDAPQLQQALEDAGLKTGDSGLQFSLRDQSSSGRDSDNGSGRNSQRLVISEDDTVPAQIAGRSYGRTLASSGGVDIRI